MNELDAIFGLLIIKKERVRYENINKKRRRKRLSEDL